ALGPQGVAACLWRPRYDRWPRHRRLKAHPAVRTHVAARSCLPLFGFALADTQGKPAPKEIQRVHEWLDNWKGLGHVVVGNGAAGHALSLTKVAADGCRLEVGAAPQKSYGGDCLP